MIERWWQAFGDSLHALLAWVEGFAASPYGGWALFGLAFVESSFFPVPPDVLLIALCLARPENAFVFAAVCAAGSVLGGMGGYAIGRYGGRPLLLRMFGASRIATVQRYYDRYNAWATGIAGLTPVPYKVFTIAGGAFAINFKIFVLASAVSRSVRFFAVAGVVYLLGDTAKQFIDKYLNLLTVAFVILLVLGFWVLSRGARRAARSGPAPRP